MSEVGKLVLAKEKARFLLLEKFCQDLLDKHFGAQRKSGGCNKDPNLFQFQNQEQQRKVIGSLLMADIRGNTRRQNIVHTVININDTRELPKKRKKDDVFKKLVLLN